MQKIVAICSAIIIVFSVSCNNNSNESEDTEQLVDFGNYDSLQKKSFVYTKYELPLSIDIYKFLKSKDIAFNENSMHSLAEKDKYFTDINRALILGVYSSDLAYATIFDKSQEAVDYFSIAIDLAYKLDIGQGYDNESLDRIYDNLSNNDTLSLIASEAYLKTCTALEKNNRVNTLPFIVFGSWIESMHILSQSAFGSSKEDGIFSKLFEQKSTLNNMISYLNDIINTNPEIAGLKEIKTLLKELKELQTEYNKINVSDANALGMEEFKNIILKVQNIRTGII